MIRNVAREIAMHLCYELSFTGLTAGELLEQREAGITEDMTADQVCEALIAVFTDSGFSVDGLTGSGMQWGANGEVSKDPLIVQITGGAYVNQ